MRLIVLASKLSSFTKQIPILLFLLFAPLLVSGQAFITTWKTDNPGKTTNTQIEIPTTGTGYDYSVSWVEVGNPTHTGTLLSQSGTALIDFGSPGTYRVEITGSFPRIYFNAASFFTPTDGRKILTVEQWGSNAWTSMAYAFTGCTNLRINAADKPNLSGVTDMTRMFYRATSLNDNINGWDVSTITNMTELFAEAESFNQPLNNWNVSNVTNMTEMFWFARDFNQDIGGWTVSNVTNMGAMFAGATSFNQDIGGWDVFKVTSLAQTFAFATAFNQDISAWKVGNVTDMSGLFNNAIAFNQDISGWNINNVNTMANMFRGAVAFTNDITGWNVVNVKDMSGMFADHPTFNQNISGWVVDNVINMSSMFENSIMFNQNISGWNVGNVLDMNSMFANAVAFNQNISGWDVGKVSDMRVMFDGATAFDQDLSGWNVFSLTQAYSMLNNSGLSVSNYDNLLEGWASQTLKPNVQFGASGLYYCSASTARSILTSAPNNWFITDEGQGCLTAFDGVDTTAPEIINGQALAIDFGSIDVLPSSKTRSFTIVNKQSITISNVVVGITGTGFTTSPAPVVIAPGGVHTFTIDLSAAAAGSFLETVSITSSNFSGSFQFSIAGAVTPTPEPEISVFEGPSDLGIIILDGQTTPLDIGYEIKGNTLIGEFTIKNIGVANLNISNITLSGSDFQFVSIPPTFVGVDATETIQVMLTGSTAGTFTETITIINDDTDEALFDFTVTGVIIGPDIAVFNGIDIYSDPEIFNGQVAAVDFGSGTQGSDNDFRNSIFFNQYSSHFCGRRIRWRDFV
jgi:surface protein